MPSAAENFYTKKRIIFILSVLVALFVFFAGLTRELPSISGSVELSNTNIIASSAEGTVIIDSNNTRLLFLNPQSEVIGQVSMEDFGTPFDNVYHVAITPQGVYVTGARFHSAGNNVLSEGLALYSHNGTFQQLITEDNYQNRPAADAVPAPSYQHITAGQNKLTLYKIDSAGIERQHILPVKSTSHIDAEINGWFTRIFPLGREGNMLLCSNTGWYYLYNQDTGLFERVSPASSIEYILQSMRVPSALQHIIFAENLTPYSGQVAGCGSDSRKYYHINWKGELRLCSTADNTDIEIASFPLSTPLLAKMLIFWLSAVYLGLLALRLFFFLLRRILLSPAWRVNITIFSALLLLAGSISWYYTDRHFDTIKQEYRAAVLTQIRQLRFNLEKIYRPLFRNMEATGSFEYLTAPENQSEISDLQHYIYEYAALAEQRDGFYTELTLMNDNGRFYSLADSLFVNSFGDLVDSLTNLQAKNNKEGDFYHDVIPDGIYQGVYYFIRGDDGEKILGMLDVGFKESKLLYQQRQFALESFISLLSVLLALYVLQQSISLFRSNFSAYRQQNRQSSPYAYIELFPVLSFLAMHSMEIDGIVFIFIMQKLLGTTDLSTIAFWIALIPGVYYVGVFIGASVLPWLQKRLSFRQLGTCLGIAATLSFVFVLVAIFFQSLPLIIASKFCVGLFSDGLLFTLINLIPLSLEEEKRRSLLYAGRRSADLATILAFMLGAYIYEYFDYIGVFAFAALAFAAVAGIVFFTVKHDLPLPKTEAASPTPAAPQNAWRFFLLPVGIVCVLFATLPHCFTNKYGGYLFPLLAAGSGISSIMVSNICVCSRVLSLTVRNDISAFKAKLGTDKTIIAGLLITSWAYGMFLANSSLIWAVIALFIITLFFDRSDIFLYVPVKAEEHGFNPLLIGAGFTVVDGIIQLLTPFIMSSGIDYLGPRYCCVVIGVICFVSALVLSRFAKQSASQLTKE